MENLLNEFIPLFEEVETLKKLHLKGKWNKAASLRLRKELLRLKRLTPCLKKKLVEYDTAYVVTDKRKNNRIKSIEAKRKK